MDNESLLVIYFMKSREGVYTSRLRWPMRCMWNASFDDKGPLCLGQSRNNIISHIPYAYTRPEASPSRRSSEGSKAQVVYPPALPLRTQFTLASPSALIPFHIFTGIIILMLLGFMLSPSLIMLYSPLVLKNFFRPLCSFDWSSFPAV